MKVSIIGTETKNIPFNYNDKNSPERQEYDESLACYLSRLLTKADVTHVALYGRTNIELDVAETLIGVQTTIPCSDIQFDVFTPYGKDIEPETEDKERYAQLQKKAKHISYAVQSDTDTPTLLIDISDLVIVFYNGEKGIAKRSIDYARKIGKKIDVVLISDLI